MVSNGMAAQIGDVERDGQARDQGNLISRLLTEQGMRFVKTARFSRLAGHPTLSAGRPSPTAFP
jgi:hypothetical protein